MPGGDNPKRKKKRDSTRARAARFEGILTGTDWGGHALHGIKVSADPVGWQGCDYPFLPVVLIPSINVRCVRKNSRMTGTVNTVAAAMR